MPIGARVTSAQRASTTSRGYGSAHQRLRRAWARQVQAGLVCWARCGLRIPPGTPWDLDHTDDRRGYLGPSHATCNRAKAPRQERRIHSREW